MCDTREKQNKTKTWKVNKLNHIELTIFAAYMCVVCGRCSDFLLNFIYFNVSVFYSFRLLAVDSVQMKRTVQNSGDWWAQKLLKRESGSGEK